MDSFDAKKSLLEKISTGTRGPKRVLVRGLGRPFGRRSRLHRAEMIGELIEARVSIDAAGVGHHVDRAPAKRFVLPASNGLAVLAPTPTAESDHHNDLGFEPFGEAFKPRNSGSELC